MRHLEAAPVVVFFHGWYGCLKVLLGAENAPCRPDKPTRASLDLLAQFDAAGVDALLVVPQLAYDEASSAPGRFARQGFFKAMLDEIFAAPEVAGYIPESKGRGRVVLVGHSGAYMPLGRALGMGEVDVSEVWMMDSHYVEVPEFRPWFTRNRDGFWPGRSRRMAFLYTEGEKTGPRSLALLSSLAGQLGAEGQRQALWRGERPEVASEEELSHPLVAQLTGVRHEQIPRRFLVPLLQTAGLPSRR